MIQLYRKEKKEDVKHRILPPILAMTTPIIFDLVLTAILMDGGTIPPDLSMAVLASGILFAYSIFKQKLFVLRPTRENGTLRRSMPTMRPGQYVLVEAMTKDRARDMFVNELASNGQGLLITSICPDQIMERYGLKSTPMLWLTSKPSPDRIDPSNINILKHTAMQFLKKGSGSVVMLDSLEYLRSFNSEKDVMRLLYELKDAAIVTGSKLIISVNPDEIVENELSLLERELESISA